MLVIGLTGGIATGKTEASRILRDLGAGVISADEIGHETYKRGTQGWCGVVAEFGDSILTLDGEVDRGKLGAIVFKDDRKRSRLNAIVHPHIRTMVENRIRGLKESGGIVVIEAALLLEANWVSLADEVWVIVAHEEQVIERLQDRDQLDEEAIMLRIRSQMSEEERISRSDAVIDNSSTLEDLNDRIRALWNERIIEDRKCEY